MPKKTLLLLLLPLLCAFSPAQARPHGTRWPAMRWEKIRLRYIAPSAVFTRLGLTHITRNGYTRDGKQGVPDPAFPPGLTDVVPYDTDHLLLVRGTPNGVSLFRIRVEAADVPAVPLHLHVELALPPDPDQPIMAGQDEPPLATQDQDGVTEGDPVQVSLGEGDDARVYQIKTHRNPDGSYWIACRTSLPLPATPSSASGDAAVFVPERVWTDPLSRKIRLGETAVFQDRASVRQAASRRLGTAGADTENDYIVRVTLSPPSAPTPTVP